MKVCVCVCVFNVTGKCLKCLKPGCPVKCEQETFLLSLSHLVIFIFICIFVFSQEGEISLLDKGTQMAMPLLPRPYCPTLSQTPPLPYWSAKSANRKIKRQTDILLKDTWGFFTAGLLSSGLHRYNVGIGGIRMESENGAAFLGWGSGSGAKAAPASFLHPHRPLHQERTLTKEVLMDKTWWFSPVPLGQWVLIWLYIRATLSLCIYSILFLKCLHIWGILSACLCFCPFVSARGIGRVRGGLGLVWFGRFSQSVSPSVCAYLRMRRVHQCGRPEDRRAYLISVTNERCTEFNLSPHTTLWDTPCMCQSISVAALLPPAGRQTVNQRQSIALAFASRTLWGDSHRSLRRWATSIEKLIQIHMNWWNHLL